jgi:uncharacterized protein (DUF2345 family)
MHPKQTIRVFFAVVLMAGLMGLPAPTSIAGAPVPLPARLAPADAAQPPQGLSAEEWAGILCQIGQAEDPLSAAALIPSQVKKLVAGDGAAGDASGISVAVSGDTVVVGTYHATVGGNLQRGAAYIYARNRGGAPDHWGGVTKLTAPDGAAYDYFGLSVALSGDTVVIGASGADVSGQNNQGAAYVFARNQGGADQWGLVKKLMAGDGTAGDWFGDAVAISGGVIVVGADYADISGRADQGAAYVFARNQGGTDQWGQVRKLTAGDGAAAHYFGGAVALSGDTAVVGAWGADVSGTLGQGAAYVFARNQGGADQWGQVKKLAAADGAAFDRFGYAVAIDGQADAVVVGAYYASVGGASRQGAAYIFIRNQGGSPDNWGQVKKLVAGDGVANDYFGRAVAVSGESVMVGAVGDETSRGSAYLFVRNQDGANAWGQVQKLTAGDGAAGDNFGIAVAGNEDADTFVLGAPGDDSWQGAAYVFACQGSNWVQQRKTTASDGVAEDWFGRSVAISGDTLVVGATVDDSYKGAAYIFVRNWGGANNWGQVKKLVASDGAANDYFGRAVAISDDTLVVGATGNDSSKGAAYIFARNWGGADNWGQVKKLTASDGTTYEHFGEAVALSGGIVVVGAWGDDSNKGAAYVFARNQSGADQWGQVKKLTAADGTAGERFGDAVTLSGDTLLVGALGDDSFKGAAYVFARNQGGADQWGQIKKLTAVGGAVGDWFGDSVALSGDTVVVGVDGDESNKGAAYVFARNQGGADQWGQVKKLTATDGVAGDVFGVSAALSGDTIVVGADGDDSFKGAAYVFARNQGGADQWGQVKKLTAADGTAYDYFGDSVTLSGDTVVVGAYRNDAGRGAAYVYQEAVQEGGGVYLPLILRNSR